MRIQNQKQEREQGSVLVLTLILGAILLVTMASYLQLVAIQGVSVSRSQYWNAALNVAEGGVEEGLAQMNASSGDFSANHWGESGGTYGPLSRGLSGGSYDVIITTNPVPTIYCTGYVTVPISGAKISRVVKVEVQSQPLIKVAFAAVYDIKFNGNGIVSDSWNSHDPRYSTNGQYDASKASTNGSVASELGLVDIGNHTINGSLYLGPAGAYKGSAGQITGNIYNDFNVQIPDAALPKPPNGVWLASPNSGSGGSLVHHFTSSGYYWVDDSAQIEIDAGITVFLDVRNSNFAPGSLAIHGGTTNSGTLNVFQESGSMSIAGNTAVDASNRPENLYYYGLHDVTSITFGGGSTFVGVIYAPQADLKLNGSGSGNGIIGSTTTKTITVNGHYDFHYDESLAKTGPVQGYVPMSWQEL